MDRQWSLKEIMEESKRPDVPLYLCHRNSQTYISYSLTFGESIWTLARLHVAKWHDIRIQAGHNSLCQMNVKFNFWNCGDRWPPSIYIQCKCLTEDQRSLMILSRGVALEFFMVTEKVTLAQIIITFNAESMRYISKGQVSSTFINFYQTWKQKTHQGSPVNTIKRSFLSLNWKFK